MWRTTASTGICPAAAEQTAIIWEGDEPDQQQHISYRELHRAVGKFANALKAPRRPARATGSASICR